MSIARKKSKNMLSLVRTARGFPSRTVTGGAGKCSNAVAPIQSLRQYIPLVLPNDDQY